MLSTTSLSLFQQAENYVEQKKKPEFFRFKSDKGCERIIRMVDIKVDPLEPAKFKHKRVPRGPPSPPAPVNHSPPRKLSMQDQAVWKVPPCISNWKNPKGYTIPLNKRLAADGRGLQEVAVSDGFAKLSEALYVAERSAREEVENRTVMAKKVIAKQTQQRNEELKKLAQQARSAPAQNDAAAARDRVREERAKEYERESRMKKRAGGVRDRDISEKMALGQSIGSTRNQHYDSRLFNQESGGIGSGLADDEDYSAYDRHLFSSQTNIYRPDKEKIAKEQDAQERQGRMQLEFEKDDEDPFGLGTLLKEAKEDRPSRRDRDRGGDRHDDRSAKRPRY